MIIGLFKRPRFISLPFFTLSWLIVSGVFAGGGVSEGLRNPTEEPASEDRWRFDAGGQIRLRGDFARNQKFTDFTFTPGFKEAQFLERTRPHVSIENPALQLKAFLQLQWYGRWGGVDRRSDVDLYQGYIEWDRILV